MPNTLYQISNNYIMFSTYSRFNSILGFLVSVKELLPLRQLFNHMRCLCDVEVTDDPAKANGKG